MDTEKFSLFNADDIEEICARCICLLTPHSFNKKARCVCRHRIEKPLHIPVDHGTCNLAHVVSFK